MKKALLLTIIIMFTASAAFAGRFYFPGEKTEGQKKREARERYEENYQKKLDYLYLQDQENLVEYKRQKRDLKLKKLEKELDGKTKRPGLKPADGPYLKR